jgi:peptidoglycan-associated lipoprotein
MHRIPFVAILVLALATVVLMGCAAKKPETTTPPPPIEKTPPPVQDTGFKPEQKTDSLEVSNADYWNKKGVLTRINFETDKWDITPEARKFLKENAAWVLAHPEFRVSVEGHCDERNTEAYNLALGERRANAAKEYLIGLGVPGERIATVSYGKAKPLCTQANDACYSENRRDEFTLIDKK